MGVNWQGLNSGAGLAAGAGLFPDFASSVRFRSTFLLLAAILLGAAPARASWRSSLYPETGYDPSSANLETDKVLQDFSYAGYRAGNAPLPDVTGPLFDVTAPPYNADPTGALDATAAIQAAINAAGAAGGGVVFLPEGTYRLSVATDKTEALLLDKPFVVLRGAGVGQTFLLNTTYTNMTSKVVIRVRGHSDVRFLTTTATATPLARDLLNSTTVIPVVSTAAFAVGDTVVVRNDITTDWVNEIGEPDWLNSTALLGGLTYRRTVVAIDPLAQTLTVDAPTRYALKLRDNARVIRLARAPLFEVGIEDFSFGNVQHPAQTWEEGDYAVPGTGGYDVHSSYFISLERTRDCWVRRVATFQPEGNTSTAHVLSGALSLRDSTHVTVEHCHFQRPQYGGGGGNGYLYRLIVVAECLVQHSEARFARHGFIISGIGTSGNVLHHCVDAETGRATGATGFMLTAGRASDHHAHLSQANLIDVCTAEDSWFEARYRGGSGSDPRHNLTAVHSVFWNTRGTGTITNPVVRTEQARYGYAIGTRGNRPAVELPRAFAAGTDPVDHVEGVGEGDTLVPFSLFQDQRARRLGVAAVLPPDALLLFPANTAEVTPLRFTVGAEEYPLAELDVAWEIPPGVHASALPGAGLRVHVPAPGVWELVCATTYRGLTNRRTFRLLAEPAVPTESRTLVATADTYIEGTATAVDSNFGSATTLLVKWASGPHTMRHGLLRFNLSELNGDLPLVTRLVLTSSQALSNYIGWEVAVRPILSPWQEMTVNWNSVLTLGNPIATYAVSPTLRDAIDVSGHALAAAGAGAATLELALTGVAQPDTSILRYFAREHSVSANRPRLELEVIPAATRFSRWIARPGLSLDQRAATADPDGDGVPNLLEMLLGRDPAVPEAAPALTFDAAAGRVAFTLVYPAPALTRLVLESSTDLATWTSVPIAANDVELLANGRRRVSAPAEVTGGRTFWRLRIEPESGFALP